MQEIRYDQLSPPEKRFVDHLEDRPSYGKEKHMSQFGPKDQALKSGNYIQLPRGQHCYVGVDLDYPSAALSWMDGVYPAPTIVLWNPQNGHANLFWELKTPVFRPCDLNRHKVNRKPLNYFKDVQYGYCMSLGGDPGYTSSSIKNPYSRSWNVEWYDNVYDLPELAEYVPTNLRLVKSDEDDIFAGRNDELFSVARKWAYRKVFELDEVSFDSAVRQFCVDYNEYSIPDHWPEKGPLSMSEVSSVATGIIKWVIREKESGGFKQRLKNHGVMKLDKIDAELHDDIKVQMTSCRQAIGAAYTHRTRKQKTEHNIACAIQKVRSENRCVVKREIAEIAGVSVATLRYYSHLFKNLYQ